MSVKRDRAKGLKEGGLKRVEIAPIKNLTESICKKIEGYAKRGMKGEDIGILIGVSKERMRGWIKQGESDMEGGVNTYCARVYKAIEVGAIEEQYDLIEKMKASYESDPRNWQALSWILERKYSDRYSPIKRQEIKSEQEGVQIVVAGGRDAESEPKKVVGIPVVSVIEEEKKDENN